jgi:phage tail protein X
MFDNDSRYQPPTDVYTVLDSQGRSVTIRKIRFLPTPAGQLYRRIVQGDRVDLLAYQYYQAPQFFWQIADANIVMDPAELVAQLGQAIVIPPRP